MSEEEIHYKIHNIVATASFEIRDRINLYKIASKIKDVEYNPERFPVIVMRMEKPRATFQIFSTGNMTITGFIKISEALKALKKVLKKMKNIGINLPNPKFTIQNIVATADLHVFLDLNKATIVMEHVIYEPEIFPGLIYYIQNPKVVFLLFSTGRIVCIGAKNKEVIERALVKLKQVVYKFNILKEPLKESRYQEIIFT